MNKQDIAIVILLVALLFGWMHYQNKANSRRMEEWRRQQAELAAANPAALPADTAISAPTGAGDAAAPQAVQPPPDAEAEVAQPDEEPESGIPEQFATLENGELKVAISTKGGAISSATLVGYRQTIAKDSGDIVFDYSGAKALALSGIPGFSANADFEITEASPTNAVLTRALPDGTILTRSFSLLPDYQIALKDTFLASADGGPAFTDNAFIGVGSLERQSRGNTSILSIDNLPAFDSAKVNHWERKRALTKLFTGGSGGGCSGAPDAAQFPARIAKSFDEPQRWVALKTRFFAQALCGESAGYAVSAARATERGPLRVQTISASLRLPAASFRKNEATVMSYRLYIGPKKLSVLRKFAQKSGDIMEFGMSKWLCVILLPILNGLNAVFHNYGVAIIVLTIMVRLLFWPLTRKSNESMKRMGAIQPQLKAIQEKFKGDPQKLQQETMKLYRDNHVNPMSSCLPMLIQIPVFIALFVVLRSATELRFAPFLWIRDLSEPENLLAGLIPGGPALNILPFLMAGTMFLQSKLTPSMGDPSQQKMMMWMMPLMMFFMFYSMPSALLLYWTVSQFLAIVQLMRQRRAREAAAAVGPDGVIDGDAVTRQERRRRERENA